MKSRLFLIIVASLMSFAAVFIARADDGEGQPPYCIGMVYCTTYAYGMEWDERDNCGLCPYFTEYATTSCKYTSDQSKKCRLEYCKTTNCEDPESPDYPCGDQ